MGQRRNNRAWWDELPAAFSAYRGDRPIDEVECIVADLTGLSRGKAMPADKFAPDATFFLPISIFYQTITGSDVDMDIANQWAESDMVLRPDMATACAIPWAKEVSLQVINDLETRDGAPVGCAPRNVLRRVVEAYRERGWQPVVAPELEFYLIKPNVDPNEPIQPPTGRTGRRNTGRQSYSMSAVDEYGPVIETIYDFARAAGLLIDTVTQEDGAGQVEINLPHGDPVTLADQVFYFKRLIREAALKNGMFATFMAKPMRDEPGSAMHLHQSVVEIASGRNIFSLASGEPSPAFEHFIGGSQRYLPQVMPLLAPNVNSYRRFESETNSSAPTNLAWGYDNRATGLRIPNAGPADRRVENRVIGIDCNPYLAIAASLASGLLGVEQQLAPSEPLLGELEERPADFPDKLDDALEAFADAQDIRRLLGEEFSVVFESVKAAELHHFHREISPWEREFLLLNV